MNYRVMNLRRSKPNELHGKRKFSLSGCPMTPNFLPAALTNSFTSRDLRIRAHRETCDEAQTRFSQRPHRDAITSNSPCRRTWQERKSVVLTDQLRGFFRAGEVVDVRWIGTCFPRRQNEWCRIDARLRVSRAASSFACAFAPCELPGMPSVRPPIGIAM